ncbi:hypothetical protein [Pelatocladus sp. BLCC-F211]|uniref:hypothetical protein n=1 Tax=Pelatocladus sp. BLCC-F211 TaxID=3342752 RepID=UPI0035BC2DE3
MKITLPSLEKQKQIAEILGTADREIAASVAYLDCLKTQKRGLMQKLLTGEWRVKIEKAGQQLTETKT